MVLSFVYKQLIISYIKVIYRMSSSPCVIRYVNCIVCSDRLISQNTTSLSLSLSLSLSHTHTHTHTHTQQNGSIKKMLTEYQQKLQALKSSVRQPPKGFTLYPSFLYCTNNNHCIVLALHIIVRSDTSLLYNYIETRMYVGNCL